MRLRTLVARTLMLSTLGALGALVGCGGAEAAHGETTATTPHLLALSTYSASLGTPIDAFIENPPTSDVQSIEIVFEGTFTRASGGEERVAMSQRVVRTDGGAVRWTNFGPFGNPFTPTNPDVGTFRGKVGIRTTGADGVVTMDPNPLPMEFVVQPSIIVTELQPTTATCDKPALRLIGLMSYKMKAQALGFKAVSMEYAFKTPGITLDKEGAPTLETDAQGGPVFRTTTVTHQVSAGLDAIDGTEAITLPPVPPDRKQYGVIFALSARDEAGRTIHSTFGMTAHNPLEIFSNGAFQLAQIYPAEPVSSCTPGGQQGREVRYNESKSETRERRSTLTLSKSWLKSDENSWSTTDGKNVTVSKSTSDSFTRTHGTSNTFSFEKNGSTTNGVSFNWSDTLGVGGKLGTSASVTVGIPEVADIGGGVNGEASLDKSWTKSGSRSSSTTSGWSQGTSNTVSDSESTSTSTATTDSTSVSKSDTKGGSTSEQNGATQSSDTSWSVSSTDTISKDFSASVIANTYGVFYRQLARYTRTAYVLEYTKCGESEVVGNVTLQDYVWAPDLAIGDRCPPFPKSNFPEAQCLLSPCE